MQAEDIESGFTVSRYKYGVFNITFVGGGGLRFRLAFSEKLEI